MRTRRLRPSRIVQLVATRHPTTGKLGGRWLPRVVRQKLGAFSQALANNHWPTYMIKNLPDLVDDIAGGMCPIVPDAARMYEEMYRNFNIAEFDAPVDVTLADGLADPAVDRALVAAGEDVVLFTGGGMVPGTLLDRVNRRFIHIHPGHLPGVRGADGILWSLLVQGQTAVSGFLMDRGIDTGDILVRQRCAPFSISIRGVRPDDLALYRALFAFVDPLLRALILQKCLCLFDTVTGPSGTPQAMDTGTTYHFMCEELRAVALARLFRSVSTPKQ